MANVTNDDHTWSVLAKITNWRQMIEQVVFNWCLTKGTSGAWGTQVGIPRKASLMRPQNLFGMTRRQSPKWLTPPRKVCWQTYLTDYLSCFYYHFIKNVWYLKSLPFNEFRLSHHILIPFGLCIIGYNRHGLNIPGFWTFNCRYMTEILSILHKTLINLSVKLTCKMNPPSLVRLDWYLSTNT